MHNHAGRFLFILFLALSFFTACAPSKANRQRQDIGSDLEGASELSSGFNISLPRGWNEVTDPEQIKKRVLWSMDNYNYTRWKESPEFRAWDGPENLNTFLSTMQIKRHRNIGIGSGYSDILRFLQEDGVTIHESGITHIKDVRCKWWIHSFGNGQIHQHCFLFAHEDYLYIFCFTTSYLSEEKKQLFEQLIQQVAFNDGGIAR